MLLRHFVRCYTRFPKETQVINRGNITRIKDVDPEAANRRKCDDKDIFDRDFADLSVDHFKEIHNGDEEIKSKIALILQEYEYIKYNTMGRVPSTFTLVEMNRILEDGTSPGTRQSIFEFMFKREIEKRKLKKRRELERALSQERRAINSGATEEERTGLLDTNGDLVYGLWHNSLFPRIPDNKMKNGKSMTRLITAATYGPTLIFDFDFENYMSNWISRNVIDQVQEAYGLNRFHYKEPFDLWFCNFKKNSHCYEYATEKAMPNLFQRSLITLKEDCFTNYFDKSRLIYLTPNAKETLGSVGKKNDVYIVGAYNDRGAVKPLTYRKAEKLGIRARSLPLDQNVAWKGSSKSLCINHVVGILLEAMATNGDWQAALTKHVPERKIKPMEQVLEEERIRQANIARKRRVFRKFNIKDDLDLY